MVTLEEQVQVSPPSNSSLSDTSETVRIVNAPSLQQTKPLDVDQSRNECEGQEVEGIITNINKDIIDQCQDDVQCGVCGNFFGTETESQQHVDQCLERGEGNLGPGPSIYIILFVHT